MWESIIMTSSLLAVIFILIFILVLLAKIPKTKLNVRQKRWWLFIHIGAAIIYLSGVLGALLLAILTTFNANRELIYAAHHFIHYFDWFLIIPGAFASLLTGVWLSVRTNWGGLTNYYWIITKWIGNIGAILFGSTFVRIGIENSTLSAMDDPIQNPAYMYDWQVLMIELVISLAILTFLSAISIFKPWGKRIKKNKSYRHPD
ncbi:DUF2269 family protein [Calidifontibacillus oryziterrae]|uniref:DUF2269 family protein n=1 Tax=Calidifontibacillus oryziterrae TaxID=1191699 RepID=UPI0002DD201A|nr:DUF2269 family protein [Calidifontibacillus oryziterrae]